MKYTVLWTNGAERDLAAIWFAAEDRDAITRASHELDKRLENDPPMHGESRYGRVRIQFAPPLGMEFEVIEESRTAFVVSVWLTRPGKTRS